MNLIRFCLMSLFMMWFFVSLANDASAFEFPNMLEITMPGTVKGVSKHFEVTNSQYLNISLDSSETINARIESVPSTIVMHFELEPNISSTYITIKNLVPFKTYYKYEDDYHHLTIFTADSLSAITVTKVDDQNYTITDDSGQTLKINLLPIQTAPILTNPAVLTMKINTLQYNSASAITLPITAMVYKWLGSPLTLLTQNVSVVPQFVVTGVYNPVGNTTEIVTIEDGLPTTETLSGVKIIKLTTQSGNLDFEF